MTKTITATQNLEAYLESFSEFQKLAAGRDMPWLRELREEAFARFCEVGFPTTHDEDWRFTNVSAIARARFRLASTFTGEASHGELEALHVPEMGCQLVFVNGRFRPELSLVGKLPVGVRVGSLAEEIRSNPQAVESHLGRYLDIRRDPFSALNTAFAEDGAFVHIRKGVVAEEPIYFLFISTGGQEALMSHPRNLVIAEAESEAIIVEDYVSLDGSIAFCNTATELVAGDSAVVSHYMIERENRQSFNISTLRIQQGRSANIASHSLLLGGGLVRNNVHPVLAGEGSECLINGLFVGNGRQHLDNYMLVEHASPHCDSRQFYNGILDGNAHGVFHGRIIVHKDAQKTDAKQTNRNLLLSDDAQIDTKPQLEIYADDVKCTHGATIGQIEENALFYLRSRGIDETSARKLLLSAFAGECLDRMKDGPVKTRVEALINRNLIDVAYNRVTAGSDGKDGGRNWEEIG
ncbi:MAG TPA: Fe-S cluster assembly protein SufD [Terriglobales bacterium]|jgi:Fe-S cluster assembly protein SufD|nr:Fe-S cluster assembly protein SufD [Terriglobales bacterium]